MPDLLHIFHQNKKEGPKPLQEQTNFGNSPLPHETLTTPNPIYLSNNQRGYHQQQQQQALETQQQQYARALPIEVSRSVPKTNNNNNNNNNNNYYANENSTNTQNLNLVKSLNSQRIPVNDSSNHLNHMGAGSTNVPMTVVPPEGKEVSKEKEDPLLQNQTVLNYLHDRGLLKPQRISYTENMQNAPVDIYVATQGENIFLPTMSSNDDEYMQNLNNVQNASNHTANNNNQNPSNLEGLHCSSLPQQHDDQQLHSSEAKILEDLENFAVGQKMAVIVSLKNRTPIKNVNLKLTGDALIYWFNGVPPDRILSKEFYKISEREWTLDMSKHHAFIPHDNGEEEEEEEEDDDDDEQQKDVLIQENEEHIIPLAIFQNKSTEELKKEHYLPLGYTRKQIYLHELLKNTSGTKLAKFYQPGYYFFFIPVYFANGQPESIYYPSARIKYTLHCSVMISKSLYKKQLAKQGITNSESNLTHLTPNAKNVLPGSSYGSNGSLNSLNDHQNYFHASSPTPSIPTTTGFFKKIIGGSSTSASSMTSSQVSVPQTLETFYDKWGLIYGDKPLNLVRIAPSRATSTADKPIYINRVWNKALAYEVSLPAKYVPLDSTLPIRIKLTPLDKTMTVKRIRVGMSEKITLVSKSLEYEFDQMEPLLSDTQNPFYEEFMKSGKKQRCLSLLEIKANDKTGHSSQKEIVVKNCKKDNLFQYHEKSIDSLIINCNIKFPKFEPFTAVKHKMKFPNQALKNLSPYGLDRFYELTQEAENVDDPYYREYVQQRKNSQSLHNDRESHLNSSAVPKERRGSTAGSILSGLLGRKSRRNSAYDAVDDVSEANIEEYLKNDSCTHSIYDSIQSQSGVPVEFETRLKQAERGLYTDSVNFSNVHAKHKLEILLRLSKFDPETQKQKHFEVIIDTPVCLLSELCVDDNVSLPTYTTAIMDSIVSDVENDRLAPPPTFEEAISVPASPYGSPVTSPFIQPMRKFLDDDIPTQSLNKSDLSVSNINNHESSVRSEPSVLLYSTNHAYQNGSNQSHHDSFNNIDDLLHSNFKNFKINTHKSGHSTDSEDAPDMLPSYQDCTPLLSDDDDDL